MSWLRKPVWQNWVYRWLHTRSIGWTRTLAARYGAQFGFVYVGGYPKSGTTWVAQLVSHYLDLPFPRDYALPPAFRCLIHHHWTPGTARAPSVYVIRDGRDVMVSEFVTMMRGVEATRERLARFGRLSLAERLLLERMGRDARLARRIESVFGRDFEPWDVERNLPRFIEANMRRPLSEIVRDPWPVHVTRWLEAPHGAIVVRYEDLLRDTAGELGRLLSRLDGRKADEGRVRDAVRRYAFERLSGRSPGEEDRTSLLRKGVAGDWKTYFDDRSTELFERHAGAALIRAGYARDDASMARDPAAR